MVVWPKLGTFLRQHVLLILIGITCEFLYLFYFVRQFGLFQYYGGLTDMARITGYSHSGFAQFVIVFSVLFLLFGLAWWDVRHLNRRSTLWLILGFGSAFGLTMSFVYPATAIDIFVYIAQSLALVQYHANPIVTPPALVANDPLIKLADGWAYYPAPYGPLGLVIDAVPTVIVGRNLLAMLLLMKLMFSAILVVEAFLVYKILSHYAPEFALAGAVFVAWNPYALFEYSANAHNDIVMMLFVLLACLALVHSRHVLAFVLLVAAMLVKYAMLPIIPLFFLYALVHQPTHKQRLIYVGWVVLWSAVLVLIVYGPFWQGSKTLDSLLFQDTRYMSSLSTMLTDISSGSVTADQAKLIGRTLFAVIYVYALWLATRDQTRLFKACFLVMFFVLALVVTNVEIWYAIWPALFALLYPRTTTHIAMIIFLYSAELSVTLYYYLWFWLGLTTPYLALVNDLAYLMVFGPALLLLCGFAVQRGFSTSV
ncbi:MAG: hypothetical protein JO202_06605 [Ktedonobacteraceae bacterium]|nr:hypothetical protein [Ktedonobacteraceae bacterium]